MYEICALSNTGKVRKHNEDSFLIMGQVKNSSLYIKQAQSPFLLAVADGVGGEEKGEVASNMALLQLSKFKDIDNSNALAQYIININSSLCDFIKDNPDHAKMGTTLAGMVCYNNQIRTFHAGDSRVYRFRQGFLRQLTRDHSLIQSLLEAGEITREEMENHPNKHIILKVLGGNCDRPLDPDVEETGNDFHQKDIYLICSDGLSDMVPLEEIETVLSLDKSISAKTQLLVNAANDHGGKDNITVVLCGKENEL